MARKKCWKRRVHKKSRILKKTGLKIMCRAWIGHLDFWRNFMILQQVKQQKTQAGMRKLCLYNYWKIGLTVVQFFCQRVLNQTKSRIKYKIQISLKTLKGRWNIILLRIAWAGHNLKFNNLIKMNPPQVYMCWYLAKLIQLCKIYK